MYKIILRMSYSTSTVIQCWQWKEVIKNRYNYRKGTKSTDPSFFCHNLCFYSSFKDTSLKASYVWIFLGFTTSLVLKHCSWWPGSSKNNYSKTHNLEFTPVHSEILNCHEPNRHHRSSFWSQTCVPNSQQQRGLQEFLHLHSCVTKIRTWFPLSRIVTVSN